MIATFIDEAQKICRVIVSEDQLSLAIGKEGQNARLAAKLTNWKIDIKGLNQYFEAYDDGILSVEFDGEADFLEANGIEVRAEDKDKIFEKIKYHESDDKEEEMDDIKDDNSLVSDNNEIAEDSEN